MTLREIRDHYLRYQQALREREALGGCASSRRWRETAREIVAHRTALESVFALISAAGPCNELLLGGNRVLRREGRGVYRVVDFMTGLPVAVTA